MRSFYPQAGVRYNPSFSEIQFALFARDVEDHAAQLYQMAFAAFARAADDSQGQFLQRLNFEFLHQACHSLLTGYRIAREDARIDQAKVLQHVNLLFWALIGAAEQLLRFNEKNDDWHKDWRSALDRGGLLARLAADLALAGEADGLELHEMIACLSQLRDSTAKVRDYHLYLAGEVPEDVDELIGLAGDAARLSTVFEEAQVKLRAREALEPATS